MVAEAQSHRLEPQFSFGLRVFITFAILFLGNRLAGITAPGIDAQALEHSTGYSPLDAVAVASTSIVALKFSPIANALVLFEFMKLAFPVTARWEARDVQNRWRLARALLLVAFALALFQGWGVASALEEVKTAVPLVPEPGDAYRFAFALTQIAGTAALAVLAGAITLYGIGSGYWVIIAAFALADTWPALAALVAGLRDGSLATPFAPAAVLATAMAAAGAIALYRKGVAEGRTPTSSAADVIRPAFLGLALGSLFYGLGVLAIAYLSGSMPAPETLLAASPVRLAVIVAMIAFVALLRIDDRSRAFQIAAIASALVIAFDYAATLTLTAPFPADAIIIAAVVSALGWDQTREFSA